MTGNLDALNKRKEELENEIDALVDHDIEAVLTGAMPANSDKILRLAQDLSIIDAVRARLITAA